MPTSRPEFDQRLHALMARLVEQGRSVRQTIELAVDAAFDKDEQKARRTREADQAIDRVDIEIEREAVALLADATQQGVRMDASDVRLILTIVKVNNEFERIADSAVIIAEKVPSFQKASGPLPPRFRVMANSVIGIMQTTITALGQMDRIAAELVLASDDATEAFKQAMLRETLEQLSRGEHAIDHALSLQIVAANLGRMADHCTNVAEQVIYVVTGKVVRHEGDRWTKPQEVG